MSPRILALANTPSAPEVTSNLNVQQDIASSPGATVAGVETKLDATGRLGTQGGLVGVGATERDTEHTVVAFGPMLPSGVPVVQLKADLVTDEVASRLAIGLLGHVLFLKNQIPLPVPQLTRLSATTTKSSTSRSAKARTELLASFDTLTSHLTTTFATLSGALYRSYSEEKRARLGFTSDASDGGNGGGGRGGGGRHLDHAYLAVVLGPSLGTAKSRTFMAVDGFEAREWGMREGEDENKGGREEEEEESDEEVFVVEDESESDSTDSESEEEEEEEEEAYESAEEPEESEDELEAQEEDAGDHDESLSSEHIIGTNQPPLSTLKPLIEHPAQSTPQSPQILRDNVDSNPQSPLPPLPKSPAHEIRTPSTPADAQFPVQSLQNGNSNSKSAPPSPLRPKTIPTPSRATSQPPPPPTSYAEDQRFLQNSERLLARVLATADAEGYGFASELAPTQTHILLRAPRRFAHPSWIPRQNISASLESSLEAFLEKSKAPPPPLPMLPEQITGKSLSAAAAKEKKEKERMRTKQQLSEGVWVTAKAGLKIPERVRDEREEDEMIWWSWDGKIVGFSDW
ncbi:hypothetical protein D9611_003003 [Ephemerocybe angulata]|uniref:Uncharacterized protein n=1 Tax=Ephemerocybe angulata TaxID=980116 RepID=A0A8H5CAB1_9AGAR|nr:hypothetical protein D9611_003003 [Tulosesus angulatus]